MRRAILVALTLFAYAAGAAAQKAAKPSGNEAAIRNLYADWKAAFEARDIDRVMALYADDIIAFDIVPPLEYRGKADYRRDYQEFLDGFDGPVKIEFRQMTVRTSGDLGVVYLFERLTG